MTVETGDAIRRDWIVLLLPIALSLRNLHSGAANPLITLGVMMLIGVIVAAAFLRPVERFPTSYGPMAIFIPATSLVVARPSSMFAAVMAVLVAALAFRLAATVDARRLIVSLIDGLGLYCLLNVTLYLLGFRSGTEIEGWRLFLTTDSGTRIIYPLERSLSLPPVIAAMYLAGVLFLFRGQGGWWRVLRLASAAAAVEIILGSATRVPAAAAVAIPLLAILFPFIRRYLAVGAVALAACSAVVLPKIIESAQTVFQPLATLLSTRQTRRGDTLAALNGREDLWSHALKFWDQRVTDLFHVAFGYGMEGHYTSGASATYYRILSDAITRDPERLISVHNSFLQQLFDGGVVGWLLMTIALLWVAARLTGYIADSVGVAAVLTFTTLMVCSMTEVLLHPSVLTYWILLLFIGIACQLAPSMQPEIVQDAAPVVRRDALVRSRGLGGSRIKPPASLR